MKFFSVFLIILWGILITSAGIIVGWQIPTENHLVLYDEIRDVSAIILTIAGLWLGVLYPSEFQKVFQKAENIENEVSGNIVSLVRILSISAINLLIVVSLIVSAHALKPLNLDFNTIQTLKRGSFVMILILSTMEVWALLILLRHTLGYDILMCLKQVYQKRLADRHKKN